MTAQVGVLTTLRTHFGVVGGAAIAGNISVETGGTFDYKQRQIKGTAYGLFQMEPAMKSAYDKWRGAEQDSADAQIRYVAHELATGSHIGPGNAAKIQTALQGSNLDVATETFCNLFERPGVPHMDRRKAAAWEAYNLYNSYPK